MAFTYTITTSGAYNHSNGAYKASQLIDSAEDGDILEFTDNSGDWRAADYGSTAYHGSWVIDQYTSGGVGTNNAITSMPGDGLNRYPERGQTVGGYCRLDAWENYGGLMFFCQGTRNTFPQAYQFQVRGDENELRIAYNDPANNIYEILDTAAVDVSSYGNDWLLMRADTGGDGITGRLYVTGGGQLGTVSTTDLRLDSGGIGLMAERRVGSSSTSYTAFDKLHLIE